MATQATPGTSNLPVRDGEAMYRARWWAVMICGLLLIVFLASYGYSYYFAPLAEKTRNPVHSQLRPSGTIGLKLGVLSALMFLFIYLYPLRKRWSRLRHVGKTKRWLDFHIMFGLLAPALITFHSSFKLHGLAGMAFWIMWAVAMSGVVGRYFYGAIPRHLSASEMTMKEIDASRGELASRLHELNLAPPAEIEALCRAPDAARVREMSLATALFTMLLHDLARPFQISRLRRRTLSPVRVLGSLGGLLPLGGQEFEEGIRLLRKQSWLSTKIVFLGKTQQVFHLWHVVHRPFSYSFGVLVIVHVGFVILLGYF